MSRDRHEASSPSVYETSVSSRGESSTSWSSAHQNYIQTQQPSPTSSNYFPINNSKKFRYSENQMDGTRQTQHNYKKVGTSLASSKWTTNVDNQTDVGVSNPSSVARYVSNASHLEKSSNRHSSSEPGVHDRFSAYVNRFANADPRMDHRQINRLTGVASPQMPYDEPADSDIQKQKNEPVGNTTQSSSNDYDIRDRIRILQQRKEKREISRKVLSEDFSHVQTFPRESQKTPETTKNYIDQREQLKARDIAKRFEGQDSRQVSQGLSHKSNPADLRTKPKITSEIEQTSSISRNLGPSTYTSRQTADQTADDAEEARRDNRVVRQLEHQNGRVAEIETPSTTSVRDLRNKLWSPNEHLIVTARPSLHEAIESDSSLMRRQESSERQGRNFNRHLLHYNGPEMAGKRGQRMVRSLSPKSTDERRNLCREANGMADGERDMQIVKDPNLSIDNPRDFNRQYSQQTQFKSRYYQAAQRGLNSASPGLSVPDKTNAGSLAWDKRDAIDIKPSAARYEALYNFNSESDKSKITSVDHVDEAHRLDKETMSTFSARRAGVGLSDLKYAAREAGTANITSPVNVFDKESQKLLDDDVLHTSIAGSSKNEDTVNSLIAKIGAVRREDPHAALEQIDAILRAESSRNESALPYPVLEINDLLRRSVEGSHENVSQQMRNERFQQETKSPNADQVFHGPKVSVHNNAIDVPKTNTDYAISSWEGSVHHQTQQKEVEGEEESDEDDSFFDETTVSAITDPTYMSSNYKSNDLVRESFTGGRPRPSSLNTYNNTGGNRRLQSNNGIPENSHELGKHETTRFQRALGTPGTSKNMSRQPERSPPPEQIKIGSRSDQSGSARSSRISPNVSHTNIHPLTPDGTSNMKASKSPNSSQRKKVGWIEASSPDSGIIQLVNSDELESKIRRWDELSTGVVPRSLPLHTIDSPILSKDNTFLRSEDLPQISSNEDGRRHRSLSPLDKRDHPWDSSFPHRLGKVDTRNTSMEGAAGVEATFARRTQTLGSQLSPERSTGSQTRRLQEETESNGKVKSYDEITARTVSPIPVPNQKNEQGGTSKEPISPWNNKKTQAMSDDFDSAWVNLPESSFFKIKQTLTSHETPDQEHENPFDFFTEREPVLSDNSRYSKDDNGTRQRTGLHQASLNSKSGVASIEKNERHRGLSYDVKDAAISQPSQTQMLPGSSARTRGIRGLLNKRKGSAPESDPGYINSTNVANRSRDSSLSRSSSIVGGKINGSTAQQTISSIDNRSTISSNANRGRNGVSTKDSTMRGRAKSLDDRRVRNPSIARKFSRLLRVYDNDRDVAQC